jgi:hypothetical protein
LLRVVSGHGVRLLSVVSGGFGGTGARLLRVVSGRFVVSSHDLGSYI